MIHPLEVHSSVVFSTFTELHILIAVVLFSQNHFPRTCSVPALSSDPGLVLEECC